MPHLYPTLNSEHGVYVAEVVYIDGGNSLRFNGGHEEFQVAAARARKIRQALMDAGEVGLKAHVGFAGERPDGFPRNGVTL